jgi:MAPEG family
MNCVENLPVYGAIVVCATAAGARSKLLDLLALIFIAARICQTVVHIVFASTDFAASVRVAFFFVQGALHDRNADFSGGVGGWIVGGMALEPALNSQSTGFGGRAL